MLILPAIDIRGGRCVRLFQGDFEQQTVYGEDPVAMGLRWEEEGAKMLHIVDLDGAKNGRATNLPVIRQIARTLAIPVEVGGGIRTPDDARSLLSAGVARVIVGTMAFEDRPGLQELLHEHAPQIVVALEIKDGRLVTRGWQHSAAGSLIEVARELKQLGVQRFLFTDVSKDGTLTEPNYHDIGQLQDKVGVPLIASGGVSSAGAIRQLDAMGVEAAIVGKALYEGTVKLGDINAG